MQRLTGLDAVISEVNRVKKRKTLFTMFRMDKIGELSYSVKLSGEEQQACSAREIPSINELKNNFNECIKNIDKKKCCYLAYDLGFYTQNNQYRTILCLISYIPDICEETGEKFSYSSNSLSLVNELGLLKLITVNSFDELNYDTIVDSCVRYKKNY